MKPRAVRIPLVGARVTLNGGLVRVINISRSGALVALSSPEPLGGHGNLTLSHVHTTVTIEGRVVRIDAADLGADGTPVSWHAAIAFTEPPPDEITELLRRVVSPRLTAEERIRV